MYILFRKQHSFTFCHSSMWDLHKTHQTACHCLSPTCICTPLPLFPSLFTQFPFTIFLLRHDLKQKKWTKKPSKTSCLSPHELSSSACPIPFFSSKPFLSFHLPLSKAFVSCGDRNDKHFLLYLSYTVNRWGKKSYSSHLCYLFLSRSLSCDLR